MECTCSQERYISLRMTFFASSFHLQILVLGLLSGPDSTPADVDTDC